MPGCMGKRPVLSPTRHPPVDEARVPGEALVGADAKAFGDARAEPLDQRVGTVDELEQGGSAVRVLEIDRDVASATQQDVGGRERRAPARGPPGARSTRITSAPMSASSIAANGPGPMPASSMMRTPLSGPDIVFDPFRPKRRRQPTS